MNNKIALITGISGQDGSFLAEYLLSLDYEVWGIIRRTSNEDNNFVNIKHIINDLNLRYADLTDATSLDRVISECNPDEIYNLAAQSHVRISFDMPQYTNSVNYGGVINILEICRKNNLNAKIFQASTSEIFGTTDPPQNEQSLFVPRSPYGSSKLAALWTVRNYASGYNLYACNGITFNHESERRGENFVTRKITKSVAEIAHGKKDFIELGNLDAIRDWGYAKDYVEAFHLMLQQDEPEDYVISTGQSNSVRDFLHNAFEYVNIDIMSNGKSGTEEEYVRKDNNKTVVKINPRFYRPTEVDYLLGDSHKIRSELGWAPKTSFKELVNIMMKNDMENVGGIK